MFGSIFSSDSNKRLKAQNATSAVREIEPAEQAGGSSCRRARIGVAVKPSVSAGGVVKWAIENALDDGERHITMICIRPAVKTMPNPMGGGRVPVSQVCEHRVAEYMRSHEHKAEQFRQELQKLCELHKVKGEFVSVVADHAGRSLVDQIIEFKFTKFVIGSSRRGLMKKAISCYVVKNAPEECLVQCVPVKPSLSRNASAGSSSLAEFSLPRSDSFFQPGPLLRVHSSRDEVEPNEASDNRESDNMELVGERTRAKGKMVMTLSSSSSVASSSSLIVEGSLQVESTTDMDDMKLRLQRAITDAEIARNEAVKLIEARTTADLAMKRAEDMRLEEIRMREAAVWAAELASKRFQEEVLMHKEAQRRAELLQLALEEEVKKREETESKVVEASVRSPNTCPEFSFEQLMVMTNNFSESNKIGEGGYGDVYKGKMHHTPVAVKVLREGGFQGLREFLREAELLSRFHHPHIVLLLGCCSERGCIVYEYMENGSLEDRLSRRGNTPAIPWYIRFKIATELTTALLFLHNAKPQAIVHKDLKPANILLDRNFQSKISDVGLAQFVPSLYTSVLDTTPVGTFAYIDPEYQRDGSFGPKSDIYALGILLLQLLTAKRATGIANVVATAIDNGEFGTVLDESAGEWPFAEAMQVACLSLACAEMERKNRPELEKVLDLLEKVNESISSGGNNRSTAPAMFLCPILQEVMESPVIAADGYTYEYEAIKEWLKAHNTSPMTNLALPNKNLTPNRLIRSAICEWRGQSCSSA